MAKTVTLSKAKKSAWTAFSQYIRRRDCLKTTGTLDKGVCITCGQLIDFKGSHAGHFIDGRGAAVLLEEDLVNLQCPQCNIFLHGNYVPYTLKMIREHGQDWVEEKRLLKKKVLKRSINDYQTLEAYYKQKFLNLSKGEIYI